MFDQYSMYLLLGFMVSYNVVRVFRPEADRTVFLTVISTVYGGTSEIQRDIIGKTYGL